MKIREIRLQNGIFIYKTGISLTKQDFHLQRGNLVLQMGFSGYYLPNSKYPIEQDMKLPVEVRNTQAKEVEKLVRKAMRANQWKNFWMK